MLKAINDNVGSLFYFKVMNEKSIKFEYQARFYTLGELSEQTEQIWFVLHGYGQLAKYFIKKFEVLDKKKHFVIAPEGLSRFYLHGFSGRIGATWMTREDRLTDIDNYISYLNAVYQQVVPVGFQNTRINFLGFSQGAATISRWAFNCGLSFHRLILWAGIFPPDLNFAQAPAILKDKSVSFIYGEQDEYLTEKTLLNHAHLKEKLGVHVEEKTYDGGHDIDPETLLKMVEVE